MTTPTTTPETTAPISNPNPVPPDTRPIADMPFEGGDATKALLTRCGISLAHEIETLGCTGATKHGLSLDEIQSLRLGLAGGGVGLPCFVESNRYCLAHNTIGGLQHEQAARYPEFAEQISRSLTRREAGHVAFTEAVRHSTDASAGVGDRIASGAGMLNGYGEMPKGAEMVEEEAGIEPHHLSPGANEALATPITEEERRKRIGEYLDRLGIKIDPVALSARRFTCPEHTMLVWTCRFCVAHAVANGELEPVFAVRAVSAIDNSEITASVVGSELPEAIEKMDAAEVREVEIYVLTKTLTRKLA